MVYTRKNVCNIVAICILTVHTLVYPSDNNGNTGKLVGLISSVIIAISAGSYFYHYSALKKESPLFTNKQHPLSAQEIEEIQKLYNHLFDKNTLDSYFFYAQHHAQKNNDITLLQKLYDIHTVAEKLPELTEINKIISLETITKDLENISKLIRLTGQKSDSAQHQAMRLKALDLRKLLQFAEGTHKKKTKPLVQVYYY